MTEKSTISQRGRSETKKNEFRFIYFSHFKQKPFCAHQRAQPAYLCATLVRAQLGYWEHCGHITAADAPILTQI